MKIALIFPALLSAILLAAADKIAIVASGERAGIMADIFLAEASGKYVFVERQELASLQAEQDLQAEYGMETFSRRAGMLGASLFVMLQERPGSGAGVRVTVFESNYGFRLASGTINSVEALYELAGKAMEKKRHPQKMPLLSIAGFRNNLPYRLKKQGKQMAAELLERLHELDAVILEREYLIELLREKQLTGQWSSALAASEILHVEFNAGDSEKNFVISSYVTAPAGDITFRHTFCNSEKGETLLTQLQAHLSRPAVGGGYDLKNEAARFDREAEMAQRKNNLIEAVRKGFAAFALNPEKPEYLRGYFFDCELFRQAYPCYFSALEYIFANSKLLDSYDGRNTMLHFVKIIRNHSAILKPEERLAFEGLIAKNLETVYSSRRLRNFHDSELFRNINQFANIAEELYPDTEHYKSALLNSWRKILPLLEKPSPDGNNREKEWLYDHYVLKNIQSLQRLMHKTGWKRENIKQIQKSGNKILHPLAAMLNFQELLLDKKADNNEIQRQYAGLCRIAKTEKLPFLCGTAVQYQQPRKTGRKTEVPQIKYHTPVLCSYTGADGVLFFLTYDAFDCKVMMRGNDNKITEFASFPRDGSAARTLQPGNWQMIVRNRLIVITNGANLYAGSNGLLTEIRGFSFPVKTVAVTAGRIYFAGDDDLMSCDPLGRDRRTHISRTQTEKALDILPHEFKITKLACSEDEKTLYITFSNHRASRTAQLDTATGTVPL